MAWFEWLRRRRDTRPTIERVGPTLPPAHATTDGGGPDFEPRKPVAIDLRPQERLTSTASAWAESLPGRLQPVALCRDYPRVANRIALCWNDPVLAESVFSDLLVDRRGNRRGFPGAVMADLLRLHGLHERRLAVASMPPVWSWAQRPLR
ncbi:hypothetical protein [Piscinibacter koreensis]|uniref:Uncharacterized protein n=1 Tax=Piscinibacter koreensis TaxID=2742824 RepID=A0A7Y6NNM7_9BURK|nr:hypothetical protein [Schlegelella koreensis]NUZ06480.1 hypothetical protein [Schlegelella koreensis]